ncbi:MAG: IS21 family transposase [Thermoplasmatales archaeon]|nr:IS21 family transposase [Thermoplasmatales archaeon]MCW6170412.1 IS21 family transposase [Thermoplasmatales archaeon]
MFKAKKEQGMNISEIARRTGVSRKTVRKYIAMEKPAKYSREGRQSVIAPYTDYVRGRIDKYNLSAVRIYDEIGEKGYLGSYTTVKRLCRELRKDRRVQAVYRYETKPGKQSQVDFGEFGYIDMDGKRRKLYAFSMILGYSRMRYAEFTTDISTENVIKMHLNAFSFFGGFTDTILYDNLKQIVIDRKIKASESRFNEKFMDFAEYYGIAIRLCYPYRPETKGKIESTIKYLRYNFWTGRTFDSLSDINVQCQEWLKKVNSQIHGTTHETPLERLKDEKLNPLSSVPAYMTRKEESRKISRDCYVSYKGNRYSVPWKYAGRECMVIEESSALKIEVDASIVADHSILSGTGRISRKKEHFEGLLKAIREENSAVYRQIVETRDLKKYEDVV